MRNVLELMRAEDAKAASGSSGGGSSGGGGGGGDNSSNDLIDLVQKLGWPNDDMRLIASRTDIDHDGKESRCEVVAKWMKENRVCDTNGTGHASQLTTREKQAQLSEILRRARTAGNPGKCACENQQQPRRFSRNKVGSK